MGLVGLKQAVEGAAREFPKWRRAGGKVYRGLVRRRAAEQALFRAEEASVAIEPPIRDHWLRSGTGQGGLFAIAGSVLTALKTSGFLDRLSTWVFDAAVLLTILAIGYMIYRRRADWLAGHR